MLVHFFSLLVAFIDSAVVWEHYHLPYIYTIIEKTNKKPNRGEIAQMSCKQKE